MEARLLSCSASPRAPGRAGSRQLGCSGAKVRICKAAEMRLLQRCVRFLLLCVAVVEPRRPSAVALAGQEPMSVMGDVLIVTLIKQVSSWEELQR